MEDIQERLRAIQTRRSQAESARARAEVEVENAENSLKAAKEQLKSEFGIVTGDDLRRVREELEEQLKTSIDEVEAALTASGA